MLTERFCVVYLVEHSFVALPNVTAQHVHHELSAFKLNLPILTYVPSGLWLKQKIESSPR